MAKFTDEILLNSVELQLIGYSWSDPSRYTIEFVVCTTNTDDNIYSERIFEVLEMKLLSCYIVLVFAKDQDS